MHHHHRVAFIVHIVVSNRTVDRVLLFLPGLRGSRHHVYNSYLCIHYRKMRKCVHLCSSESDGGSGMGGIVAHEWMD